MRNGTANPSSFSIYILGQENSGKTCLVATLLEDDFVENMATHVVEIEACIIHASEWCRVKKNELIMNLQNKYYYNLQTTVINSDFFDEDKTLETLSEAELPKSFNTKIHHAKAAVLKSTDGNDTIIWDFAGQSVYDGLHCMLLQENSVVMIVFDASQNLLYPGKSRDCSQDPYTEQSINPETTGCESIIYWL